jgi:hypothetical protein
MYPDNMAVCVEYPLGPYRVVRYWVVAVRLLLRLLLRLIRLLPIRLLLTELYLNPPPRPPPRASDNAMAANTRVWYSIH